MLPQLPDGAIQALRAKDDQFLIAFHNPSVVPGACPNCQGMKFIQFFICEKKGFENPGWKPFVVKGDKCHEIFDHLSFPCPVCQAQGSDYMTSRRNYLFSRSGLTQGEQNWKIEYLKDKDGKKYAYNYALQILATLPLTSGFALLYGDYGMGKSGVLKSIVAQAIWADIPARYISASELLREIRSTYGESSQSEIGYVSELDTFRILAIDEVDAISDTSWAESTMRDIIDHRYARQSTLCTLFASNSPPARLWGYLNSRLDDGYKLPVTGQYLRGAL